MFVNEALIRKVLNKPNFLSKRRLHYHKHGTTRLRLVSKGKAFCPLIYKIVSITGQGIKNFHQPYEKLAWVNISTYLNLKLKENSKSNHKRIVIFLCTFDI